MALNPIEAIALGAAFGAVANTVYSGARLAVLSRGFTKKETVVGAYTISGDYGEIYEIDIKCPIGKEKENLKSSLAYHGLGLAVATVFNADSFIGRGEILDPSMSGIVYTTAMGASAFIRDAAVVIEDLTLGRGGRGARRRTTAAFMLAGGLAGGLYNGGQMAMERNAPTKQHQGSNIHQIEKGKQPKTMAQVVREAKDRGIILAA